MSEYKKKLGTRGWRKLPPPKGRPSKEVIQRLLAYLKPLWPKLALAMVCMLVVSGIGLGYTYLVKQLIDVVKSNSQPHVTLSGLNLYAGLGLLAFALKGAFGFGQQYLMANVTQRLGMRLRNEVYAHLQSLPLSFYDTRKTGQLMSSVTNDVPALQGSFTSTVLDTVSAPVTLFGGIVVMFVLNWRLALLTLICLPAIAFVIHRASRLMKQYTSRLQGSLAEVSEVMEETIAGVRIVKSFANEKYETDRFNQRSTHVFRSQMRTVRVKAIMSPLIELIGAFGIILVLWFGGREVILHPSSNFTPGSLVGFVLVVQQVAGAARNVGGIMTSYAQAGAAAERIFDLLDIEPEIQDKPDAVELPRGSGRVQFENVSFSYRDDVPVLDGVSLEMKPGQVVAVVGPTGSGKTTIAALIPRFYEVSHGCIRVDGHDIRDVTMESLRGQIGIVPQDTILFAGTLRDNIAYGRLDATFEEIVEAAKTANAHEFISRWPDGYDTIIGERGVCLSGGQRQRIAIARAVLRNPRILILDEATSSLDTRSEALVQDALDRLMEHRTTLVIAHRLSTIRNADTILVLKDGRVVEQGRHDDLLKLEGLYAQLYRTQFRWEGGDPPPFLASSLAEQSL